MFNTSDNQGYALEFTGVQDSTPCDRSNPQWDAVQMMGLCGLSS